MHDQTNLTWQQAKAMTQDREMEIARIIPVSAVASIEQHATGTLFSCDSTQYNWLGMTTVELAVGEDAEEITKRMEARFRDEGEFDVETWVNIGEKYRVELVSRTSAEGYIFGEGDPGTVVIDSWSPCFTLPEDVYPGGRF